MPLRTVWLLLGRLRAGVWLCLLIALATPWARAWDVDRMLRAAALQGERATSGVRALQALVGELRGQDERARLEAINRFFNQRIIFRTDLEVWGQLDYWASPLELLSKGQGDCEDYVIAKYFSLLAAGVPETALRLVYVRAQLPGTAAPAAHMVLAYYARPGADPSILDNLVPDIRPASLRPDLTPVFSFNTEGLWQGPDDHAAGDPLLRLSPWRDVVAKARAEGFP